MFSKRSKLYNPEQHQNDWESLQTGEITITVGTLVYWLKHDNPELYSKITTKNKKPILNEQQIQGPKIEPIDPKSTSNSTLSPNANKTNSVYPDIFGPDSKNAPGHLDSIHNTSSTHFNELPQPNNEYLGFEEVSNSGDAMPFLSDFSKFMK